jgi:hypothetical protein
VAPIWRPSVKHRAAGPSHGSERIVESWRLQPGRMLLIDLEKGRIVSDEEIKGELIWRPSVKHRAAGPSHGSIRAAWYS